MGGAEFKEWIDEAELVALAPFARSYWAQRRTRAAKKQIRPENRGPAFYKVGRAVLYKRSEVEEWLARHRVDPVTVESNGRAKTGKEQRR